MTQTTGKEVLGGTPSDSRISDLRMRLGAFRLQRAGVVYAFLVIVVSLEAYTVFSGAPQYLSVVNVRNVLDQTSFVAILAIFMTVVLVSGNFDLSVASVAALSAGIALTILDSHGVLIAAVLALLSGTAVGVVNGLLVQKVGINAFIVTLATLTGVRGVLLILTGGRTIQAQGPALVRFESGFWAVPQAAGIVVGLALLAVAGWRAWRLVPASAVARGTPIGFRLTDPATASLGVVGLAVFFIATFVPGLLELTHPTWFLLILTAVIAFVLRFTLFGRRLYAAGGNAEAARLSGINVARYRIGGFILNGFMAAFVGLLYAGKFGAVNGDSLNGTELTVLAAAILGGTSLFGGSGSVVKSVVGALILFTLANGFNILNLGSTYQGLVQGIVIIVAAAVYTVASRKTGT